MTLNEKIINLKQQLDIVGENYAESFKADIHILIGEFNSSNPDFIFYMT
jgi:hypothetical protein